MKRKRKRSTRMPTLILVDRREYVRFLESIERLNSLVNDLSILVDTKKRRSAAAAKANQTRGNGAAAE